MSDPKLLKELSIKTGIVKRLVKEHATYVKEAEKETEKLNKMKGDPSVDEYTVKKFGEVVQETRGMIPVVAGKAHKAAKELQAFLEANQGSLEGTDEYNNATAEVQSANELPLFY